MRYINTHTFTFIIYLHNAVRWFSAVAKQLVKGLCLV